MMRKILSDLISDLIIKKDYENALLIISCMAETLDKYSKLYIDFDLESNLCKIQKKITFEINTKIITSICRKTIIFYDGFGLDTYEYGYMYLSALVKMECNLIYIVRAEQIDKISATVSLLKKYNAKIICIPKLSLVDEYKYLIKIMYKFNPQVGFLYTSPNDVSGIMAFMEGKGRYIRYQINLTDKAFRLGCYAFDFYIESSDYDAGVSYYCRNIPKEKIIKLPCCKQNFVITQDIFYKALNRIVDNHDLPFEISYYKPDTERMEKVYENGFDAVWFEKIILQPKYFGLFKFLPYMFSNRLIVCGSGYDSAKDIQVSVILVNYNPSWEKLKQSLCSVLLQKDINIEIIVTDDGSTENYFPEIEDLFAEFEFNNYVLFASEKNRGTCFNHYRALINARGKYTKEISPGDYLYNECTLSKFYAYAESHSVDICFGNAIYYSNDDNGFKSYSVRTQPRNIKIYDKAYANPKVRKKAIILNYSVLNDFICGASYFYKTKMLVRYATRILGRVKYAEDNSLRLMVLDEVDIYHYDVDIVWYEYGSGISTQKSQKWSNLLNKDLQAANKIMLQCSELAEWFPDRYKLLLKLGQKRLFCYALFPEMFFYKCYNIVHPTYTKQVQKNKFFEQLENC